MTRRSKEVQTAQFCAFAAAVSALPPEAWHRLRATCATLEGVGPEAIAARAQLFALPFSPAYVSAEHRKQYLLIQGIATATEVVIFGLGLSLELLTTFIPSTREEPWTRPHTTGDQLTDQWIDANNSLRFAIWTHAKEFLGVATAIRAAGNAINNHDSLSESVFSKVYQWVENEIPYAKIDPGGAH